MRIPTTIILRSDTPAREQLLKMVCLLAALDEAESSFLNVFSFFHGPAAKPVAVLAEGSAEGDAFLSCLGMESKEEVTAVDMFL